MVQDKDDEIIELTQVVGQDSSMETDQEVIELTEIEPDVDMAIDDPEPQGASLEEKLGEITQDQLEDALERIIEKKFSKTIEKILFEVMEKVIQKEIRDIKEGLLKDLDDIGSA